MQVLFLSIILKKGVSLKITYTIYKFDLIKYFFLQGDDEK